MKVILKEIETVKFVTQIFNLLTLSSGDPLLETVPLQIEQITEKKEHLNNSSM